jgi:hypothetical protein
MLASIVHVLPLTTIRRERAMPISGRLLVRQGQKVAPRDIIAEATLAPEHLLLNVSRSLGVSTKQAQSFIQREVGDEVAEGDLIAGPVGLTRRVLRAPVSGRISIIRKGKILLEVETVPHELQSGMTGVVTDLISDRGAVIETVGALIQGVWGNGEMDFGLMQNMLQAPDGKLTSDQLDVSLRGTIILGGYCDEPKALHNAADIPVKGLILSSISATLIPLAEKMPYPIVVLRGFGFRPFDSVSYNLLTTNQNREISINAVSFDHFSGTRPEIVIPLSSSNDPNHPLETEDYEAGQNVRLMRSTDQNSIGTIEYILDTPAELPSGLRAVSAKINLENGETAIVPLANLEVLT